MTQQRRITPSGWLAIALAAYIIIFGLAFEFFRNRANRTTTPPTTNIVGTQATTTGTLGANNLAGTGTLGATGLGTTTALAGTSTAANPLSANFRASIVTPANNTFVSGGVPVNVRGRIGSKEPNERFFLVLETPGTVPAVVYPQQELSISPTGEWAAQARYGSRGKSYRAYVIGTKDVTAVTALFSHEALAGLPNGFNIVSNVNVNTVQ